MPDSVIEIIGHPNTRWVDHSEAMQQSTGATR